MENHFVVVQLPQNMHTMDSAFSVDEISDAFWQSPATSSLPSINRSQSEWALENFLEEVSPSAPSISHPIIRQSDSSDSVSQLPESKVEGGENEVVEIKVDSPLDSHIRRHHFSPPPLDPSPASAAAPVGSDHYRAFLKTRLDLACAAVALSRVSALKPVDSASLVENHSQISRPVLLNSQAHGTANGFAMAQNEPDGGPLGIPALPTIQKKSGVQVRQTTSESSREESDEDEIDGDMETTDNMDPADAKRARRMLSNRESARRSRRRKQEQMNELETQVGQLKIEHNTLLKRLTDANSKYDEAAVDNRILKADIETLRAKVKMAEERVKRVTGFNPLLLAMSNIPSESMPFVGSRIDSSTNAALPIQPNPNPYFNAPVPGINAAAHNNGFPSNARVSLVRNSPNDPVGNVADTSTMQQHVANINHVQQQIHAGTSPCGAMSHWDTGLTHPVSKNNKKK